MSSHLQLYIYGWSREIRSLIWFRYIDDTFFICTHGKEHLETFLQELNNFNPDLKFTFESNDKEIPFLGLKVKLNVGKTSTDLYIKSADRYQCLHFISSHPNHNKRATCSQGLRMNKICLEKEDFLKHIREIKLWFFIRCYL